MVLDRVDFVVGEGDRFAAPGRDRKRVEFFLENLVQATAPSNVPLVNPASAKAVIDTAGLSLLRGGKQLVKDVASAPRIPEMVDGSDFVVGENIAATPGGGYWL